MKKHCFTIIASGLNPEADDFEDRFFEAGCDDATLSVQKGAIVVDFNREARNFSHAIASAIRDVTKAGAKVEHVEPDHLVNASDIARRSGLGRASVSLYTEGRRGSDFPAPVRRIRTDSPLWDWLEIAAWMFRRRLQAGAGANKPVTRVTLSTVVQARIVRDVNVLLSGGQTKSRLATHVWIKQALGRRHEAAR